MIAVAAAVIGILPSAGAPARSCNDPNNPCMIRSPRIFSAEANEHSSRDQHQVHTASVRGSEQKVDSLPALTGLRGIAALWVVLFHLDADHVVPFIRNGYLGVDIFFILSGFIVTCLYTPRHRILSNTISTILVGSSVTYLSSSFICFFLFYW